MLLIDPWCFPRRVCFISTVSFGAAIAIDESGIYPCFLFSPFTSSLLLRLVQRTSSSSNRAECKIAFIQEVGTAGGDVYLPRHSGEEKKVITALRLGSSDLQDLRRLSIVSSNENIAWVQLLLSTKLLRWKYPDSKTGSRTAFKTCQVPAKRSTIQIECCNNCPLIS